MSRRRNSRVHNSMAPIECTPNDSSVPVVCSNGAGMEGGGDQAFGLPCGILWSYPRIADIFRGCVPAWLTVAVYEDANVLKIMNFEASHKIKFLVIEEAAWRSLSKCAWLAQVRGVIVMTDTGGKDTKCSFRQGDTPLYVTGPLTDAIARECTMLMMVPLSCEAKTLPSRKVNSAASIEPPGPVEPDTRVKDNVIRLYERELGRSQNFEVTQLELLLNVDSKINMDGSVVIALREPSTPPDSLPGLPSLVADPLDSNVSEEKDTPTQTHKLFDPEMQIFNYDDDTLLELVKPIFDSFGILERLDIDPVKFRTFTIKVKGRYQVNHYHNFRHAFDVLQTVAGLIRTCTELELPHITLLGLLLAALCHDVKHPGLTNPFLSKSKSPLSTWYNGQSVLENYHTITTIAILNEPGCDILCNMSECDRESCEATILQSILWTDMAKNSEKLLVFEEVMKSKRPLTHDDYNLIAAVLLKCSDVSNVWKPWATSYRWSTLLIEEMRIQGEIEMSLWGKRTIGPDKPMDQREFHEYIGSNTLYFIQQFVEPMTALLCEHLPSLTPVFDSLSFNAQQYRILAEGGALS